MLSTSKPSSQLHLVTRGGILSAEVQSRSPNAVRPITTGTPSVDASTLERYKNRSIRMSQNWGYLVVGFLLISQPFPCVFSHRIVCWNKVTWSPLWAPCLALDDRTLSTDRDWWDLMFLQNTQSISTLKPTCANLRNNRHVLFCTWNAWGRRWSDAW